MHRYIILVNQCTYIIGVYYTVAEIFFIFALFDPDLLHQFSIHGLHIYFVTCFSIGRSTRSVFIYFHSNIYPKHVIITSLNTIYQARYQQLKKLKYGGHGFITKIKKMLYLVLLTLIITLTQFQLKKFTSHHWYHS